MNTQQLRNTYEESPEQLKELVHNESSKNGQRLQERQSRDRLLKEHQGQLQLLAQASVPIRSFVLPLPYPPSRFSVTDGSCRKIQINDILVQKREADTMVVLRTITSPYVYSATVTVAEDEAGNVARLTICNQEDTFVEPIFPDGTVVVIKQPCWSRLVDGGYHVRVDHPSDIVLLGSHEDIVPENWRKLEDVDATKDATKWAKEGDMMFLKKRFRRALECYDHGLRALGERSNPATAIDIYRKKCGVNIVLLRLGDACKDLSAAIATFATSTPELSDTPISNTSVVDTWLNNRSLEDPHDIAARISRPLQQLAARIKFDIGVYQPEPVYNIPLISNYVGPLTLHVDAANYVSDTEVKDTTSHGRGLFAKRAFKAGDLVCAEKAFVMPGYFIQDSNSDCLLYSLGDETASPRPGALLFKELIQKLRWNPSLRKEFFDLDDAGYWKNNGWECNDDEDISVDVFRVEKIRQLNCFSVPTRSLDLLSQPPNSNPELRNGFWTHASYINHSCLPNTVRTFIGDIHFLRATRDIAPGEELTHQYVAPEIDIEDRQKKYSAVWGFGCDCKLCELDGAVSVETRKQRLDKFEELKSSAMRLGERGITITAIKKIARSMRGLEALYSPLEGEDPYAKVPRLALVHPTLFLTEAWKGVGNVDKTIEYSRKLLRNFGIITTVEEGRLEVTNEAGLINVEAVRALKYLAEGYRSKGETEIAEQCLRTARVWFTIITGGEVGADAFFKS